MQGVQHSKLPPHCSGHGFLLTAWFSRVQRSLVNRIHFVRDGAIRLLKHKVRHARDDERHNNIYYCLYYLWHWNVSSFVWYVHIFFLNVCAFVFEWSKTKSAKIKKLGHAKLSLTVPGMLNHLTASVTKRLIQKTFPTSSSQHDILLTK